MLHDICVICFELCFCGIPNLWFLIAFSSWGCKPLRVEGLVKAFLKGLCWKNVSAVPLFSLNDEVLKGSCWKNPWSDYVHSLMSHRNAVVHTGSNKFDLHPIGRWPAGHHEHYECKAGKQEAFYSFFIKNLLNFNRKYGFLGSLDFLFVFN